MGYIEELKAKCKKLVEEMDQCKSIDDFKKFSVAIAELDDQIREYEIATKEVE